MFEKTIVCRIDTVDLEDDYDHLHLNYDRPMKLEDSNWRLFYWKVFSREAGQIRHSISLFLFLTNSTAPEACPRQKNSLLSRFEILSLLLDRLRCFSWWVTAAYSTSYIVWSPETVSRSSVLQKFKLPLKFVFIRFSRLWISIVNCKKLKLRCWFSIVAGCFI